MKGSVCVFVCACTCPQLCPTLCNPMDCSRQAPLSMEFSRQEYWSGLPFTSPGDLPDPWIEPGSPALQADSLPSEPPGKDPRSCIYMPTNIYTCVILKRCTDILCTSFFSLKALCWRFLSTHHMQTCVTPFKGVVSFLTPPLRVEL